MQPQHSLETWSLHKPAVTGQSGLVASQHYRASEVGADVLRQGGNAVDAAIATSFAIGTQEPWMSGLGGGGFMMIYLAAEDTVQAIDFGMRAPQALDPADYPLAEGTGSDLFNWPAVVDDHNLKGYSAVAVPGHVAGLALAQQHFASRSWSDCLQPAIALAEQGMAVDWYATLKIAAAARDLSQFDESNRVYLPDGFAPAAEWGGPLPRIQLARLDQTLRRLATAGADDFYQGEIAQALCADLATGGNKISAADLTNYQARLLPAETMRYRDADVWYAPGLTAGPSLAHALQQLQTHTSEQTEPDGAMYSAYAHALQTSYRERLATMGDINDSRSPACTTHISVVDKAGNMVALTQTLLSVFGSKVVLPQTGILMNNGIMWFDPRPDQPNSIGAGKKPLSNMCPTIVKRSDGTRYALGASGGRRIMPAVFQLTSFLVDYQMDLDDAFQQPRIDSSGNDTVTVDVALDDQCITELNNQFNTQIAQHGVYPALFACPNSVAFDSTSGEQVGAAFIPSPWAKVACA